MCVRLPLHIGSKRSTYCIFLFEFFLFSLLSLPTREKTIQSTSFSQILVTQPERPPHMGSVTFTALLGFGRWDIHRTADWWNLRHQLIQWPLGRWTAVFGGCYALHLLRISCAIFLDIFSVAILLQVFPLLRFHTLSMVEVGLGMLAVLFVTSPGGLEVDVAAGRAESLLSSVLNSQISLH